MVLSQFHSCNISPLGYITYLNMDEHVKRFSFTAGGIQVLRLQVQHFFPIPGTFGYPANMIKLLLCTAAQAQGGGEKDVLLSSRHIVGSP